VPERPVNLPESTDDHALLLGVIKQAGDIARRFFQTHFKRWDKSKNNPVTEADMAIDAMLHAKLTTARPAYGWLSEETEDNSDRLNRDKVWIVDPIDGTRAFIKGVPHFVISIALCWKGLPISAAIYNPITDELFEAQKGKGALLNGNVINVSARQKIKHCRMLGDAALFASKKWQNPWPAMHIESRNSIALRMGMVASGAWDACLTLAHKADWDIAASDLIVTESGGIATNHRGETFIYNRNIPKHHAVVTAGPALHAQLIDRVRHIPLSDPK